VEVCILTASQKWLQKGAQFSGNYTKALLFFVHTSREICAVAKRKVGLTTAMLKGQPAFAAMLEELLSWIGDAVNEMNQ